jgi:uncharacterized protein
VSTSPQSPSASQPPPAPPALSPPLPRPDPDSEGYWRATRDGRLAVCRCLECRTWQHPALERCRYCDGRTGFEEVSGRGTVFSFIVVRHPMIPGRAVPYIVGIIELAEQPGLHLSAIIDADPDTVTVGAAATARLADLGDSDFRAPEFTLTAP